MPYGRKHYRRKVFRSRRGRTGFTGRRRRGVYRRKSYGGHSQRRKNVRSCGQGTLTDAEASPSNDPVAGTATLFFGDTAPANTIAVSWNHVDTGSERFNKAGDYIWRTGFWMKLRMTHAAAEINPRNDQMRVMLVKTKSPVALLESLFPPFDRPVGKEFLERFIVLYDRIIKVGNKGFNTTSVAVVRDFWIKLKMFDKLDFHGVGQGDVVSIDLPHQGRLGLYCVLPEARTAGDSVLINILDWKMYYYNSNA